ncbi:MAG: DUF5606 domain-containing protein [Fimbriimonadaceae bacterium]|nr:DUF5606 domain-containing protein [Chitinophagales bacterium]
MRIKEIVAIGGMSGLYKTESQKASGLIVTSLKEGWTKFVSNRQHLFSPLENVSIYTDGDTIDIADVMLEINKQKDINPPADSNASNDALRDWFTKIVPNHDREKVYVSDIKKLIKWYAILEEKGVITDEIKAREEESKETEEESKETEEDSKETKEDSKTEKEENKDSKKEEVKDLKEEEKKEPKKKKEPKEKKEIKKKE